MSTTRITSIAAAILSATLLAPIAPAQNPADKPTIAPEIVRLSLVQGDVRVTRGPKAAKAAGSAWEKATVNLPLESGFSLATGDGRAEIEFEDASTIYLAPNSALTLNDLTAFNSVPSSTFTLLTGTVTLNLRTTIPGERFHLDTPVGQVDVPYPGNAIERVTAYLDAMAITKYQLPPANPQDLDVPKHAVATTIVYRKGLPPQGALPSAADDSSSGVAWDRWVAARIGDRDSAMTRVMHQASLNVPLPGLDEMDQQGSFFPCEPYGTCWQPSAAWNGSPQQTAAAFNAQAAANRPYLRWEDIDDFPCIPVSIHQLVAIDPVTHQRRIVRSEFSDNLYPWDWTVCHTGSWIRYHHRYAWVVGRHRHHQCPVHWVKANGRTGFVPIHPRDVKGKPPVNIREGIFAVDHKRTAELTAFKEGDNVKLLSNAPKFTREPALPTLARADAPHLEVRTADRLPGWSFSPHTFHGASTLTFNPHAQTFMLARQSTVDGHPHSTVEPFGGRIDHPNYASSSFRNDVAAQRTYESYASSRSPSSFSGSSTAASPGASSFAGSSGSSFHGESSGGSFHGESSGGSFHGGGGGFSGGGSTGGFSHGSSGGGGFSGGGGGGFHGGGGGSSSPPPAPAPAPSSSSSAPSSSAGGGSSHH